MKRFIGCSKNRENSNLWDRQNVSSSLEFVFWRKKPIINYITQHFSQNQNAIDHPHAEKEDNFILNQKPNQKLLSVPSVSINSVMNDPVETQRDANINSRVAIITRCTSKPSRQESVQIATAHTRKRQRDRYIIYRHHLQENQLYSLTISSKDIECHGNQCQPSVFNISHRCRTIISNEKIDSMKIIPLMNEQDIKQNISYISLTNVIDHEPNVSRRDSYLRSTSNILMHKPSLFLTDLFNKMTNEQRAKSIANLYENLTQSNMFKLQRTASLPNLDTKLMKLYSVTSIFSEKPMANKSQVNMEAFPREKEFVTNSTNVEQIDQEVSGSILHDQQISHEQISDNLTSVSASPTPFSITHLPTMKSSPILFESNRTNAIIDSSKIKANQSNNSLGTHLDDQSLKLKSKSFQTLDVEQIDTHPSSTKSNWIDNKTNSDINVKIKNDVTSKSTVLEQYDWDCEINQQSKVILPSMSNIEKKVLSPSLHLQQDITLSNTNLGKSVDTPSKKLDTIQLLPTIDDRSQSSHSSLLPKKVSLTPLLPIDDGETSLITRTTTASTNLTVTNDDNDDQSKLINEQLRRSSLGLARDSLELIRNTTAYHLNKDEQIIPSTDNKNISHPRKSVLKSHLDSSENLSTPLELISYVAIDNLQGDKHLLEKHMQRRSLTLGNGGTVISCRSPRPRRDSLTLLQERYSGSATPHSGHRLSSSEDKHVEFIHEPGNTITPVLHIGRGTRLKHSSNKPSSPSCSADRCYQQHLFGNSAINTFERRKSDTSIMDTQQSLKTQPFALSSSKTTSLIHTNDIEEERIYINKNDYDEIIRLLVTPLMNKKTKSSVDIQYHSEIQLHVHHRLTTLQNIIFVLFLISFYVFVFIKSQYWDEYYY